MRDRVSIDPVSLGAGAVLVVIGLLVMLDSTGALSVPLGWMAVLLTAALGVILLLSGLVDGGSRRHD